MDVKMGTHHFFFDRLRHLELHCFKHVELFFNLAVEEQVMTSVFLFHVETIDFHVVEVLVRLIFCSL